MDIFLWFSDSWMIPNSVHVANVGIFKVGKPMTTQPSPVFPEVQMSSKCWYVAMVLLMISPSDWSNKTIATVKFWISQGPIAPLESSKTSCLIRYMVDEKSFKGPVSYGCWTPQLPDHADGRSKVWSNNLQPHGAWVERQLLDSHTGEVTCDG